MNSRAGSSLVLLWVTLILLGVRKESFLWKWSHGNCTFFLAGNVSLLNQVAGGYISGSLTYFLQAEAEVSWIPSRIFWTNKEQVQFLLLNLKPKTWAGWLRILTNIWHSIERLRISLPAWCVSLVIPVSNTGCTTLFSKMLGCCVKSK